MYWDGPLGPHVRCLEYIIKIQAVSAVLLTCCMGLLEEYHSQPSLFYQGIRIYVLILEVELGNSDSTISALEIVRRISFLKGEI